MEWPPSIRYPDHGIALALLEDKVEQHHRIFSTLPAKLAAARPEKATDSSLAIRNGNVNSSRGSTKGSLE